MQDEDVTVIDKGYAVLFIVNQPKREPKALEEIDVSFAISELGSLLEWVKVEMQHTYDNPAYGALEDVADETRKRLLRLSHGAAAINTKETNDSAS